MEQPATPELEKLAAVSDESQKLGAFLDWCASQGWKLGEWKSYPCRECDGCEDALEEKEDITPDDCEEPSELMFPINTGIEKLLAQYFSIDLNKVEEERRALLAHIRSTPKP
jgi:hypothetical protein